MVRIFLLMLACVGIAQAGDLSVGIGEVDISPKLDGKKPVYMAGFGHDRPAKKIHDPLMARAIVLSDGKQKVALVSVDVVGLFNEFVEGVRKEVPGFKYVCISSTHNHEGPDTVGLWGKSPFVSGVDPEYMKSLRAGIVKAIQEADKALKPATAAIGRANAPELLHDGRDPQVLHDELVAIRFVDSAKKPLGVLVQWNCHPETMSSKNNEITADYVATTVTDLRKSQQCPVVYFTGTVGGLMTSLHVPLKGAKGENLEDGTWEKTELFGRELAKVADKALQKAQPVELTPFDIRSKSFLMPVANDVFKLGWRVGVLDRTFYHWNKDPYGEMKATETKDLTVPGAMKTEIGYVKLGEVDIAVIPGEVYPELVLSKVQDPIDPGADFQDAPIEPGIYAQMPGKYKMLIGLGNDEIGYILSKRQWDAKAPYCYGRKKDQYGEINSVGPDAGPILCKVFQDLVKGK